MTDSRRWKQLAFLFAIPVVAAAVFQFGYQREKSEWLDAVRIDFPSATAAELQERSLDATCADVKRRGVRALPCILRNYY
jgi:hypothetical protein